eukprot:GHVR01156459.1.p1 GENE.GHVR01156459.1~~GHVR01156459.1.p1  ORF type:complete len:368 (+),score=75.68 GHVR01156459.1:183-1286(+)
MATEFKKAVEVLNELESMAKKLAFMVKEEDPKVVIAAVELYRSFKEKLELVSVTFSKLKKRAYETDPDMQVYGEKMRETVKEEIVRFETICEIEEFSMRPVLHHKSLDIKANEERMQRRAQAERLEMEESGRVRQFDETRHEEEERQTKLAKKMEIQREALEALENLEKQKEEDHQIIEAKLDSACIEELRRNHSGTISDTFFYGVKLLSSRSKLDFRNTLGAIQTLLNAVVSYPELSHMRVIRLSSPKFLSSIGNRPGAMTLLKCAGFVVKPFAEVKASLRTLPEGTPIGVCDKESFLLMEEPPVECFDEWQRWSRKLHTLCNFFQGLQDDVGTLTGEESSAPATSHADDALLEALWSMAGCDSVF